MACHDLIFIAHDSRIPANLGIPVIIGIFPSTFVWLTAMDSTGICATIRMIMHTRMTLQHLTERSDYMLTCETTDHLMSSISPLESRDTRTSFCFGVDQVNILRLLVVCSLFVSLKEE